MKEYIEREAAKAAIRAKFKTIEERTEINEALNAVPAADVIEVVRCKDCDLWNEWDEAGHKQTGNCVCSCAYFSNEDGYVVYTGPDDYCSYGERKEG